MRPSFQLDASLLAPASTPEGTERHTLPGLAPESAPASQRGRVLDGLADDFFAAGDDGRFDAGQEPEAEELELEEPPVTVVVRTPEMDARRARFTRVVAGAVGSFAALLAFGVVLNAARAASAPREADPGSSRVEAQSASQNESPKGLPVAAATPARGSEDQQPAAMPELPAIQRAAAAPNAPLRPTSAAASERDPLGATAAPARAKADPGVAAPRSPRFEAAAPVAQAPRSSSSLPSVANFAARSGDAPKNASKPPTASFAPMQ